MDANGNLELEIAAVAATMVIISSCKILINIHKKDVHGDGG